MSDDCSAMRSDGTTREYLGIWRSLPNALGNRAWLDFEGVLLDR
jgi:hypothetical protein